MTLDRRTTLRWAAAVAATAGIGVGGIRHFARDRADPPAEGPGYGKDPPRAKPRLDVWPLRLSADQRWAARTLADQLLPGDPNATPPCPPASKLGLEEFFDEWLSAPYPDQRDDRRLLIPLLDAVARTSTRAIPRNATLKQAVARFRVLTAAAYYTTPEGLAAIGFVGYEARERFDGPPPEVAQRFEAAITKLAR